jgi:hypothetical protein
MTGPSTNVVFLVVSLPAIAALAAWWLLRHTETIANIAKWHALHKTHGSGYYFDDRLVRIEEREGRIGVAVDDVFAALGQSCDAQTRRRMQTSLGDVFFTLDDGTWYFEAQAVLQWLQRPPRGRDRRAVRLGHWLEHEVLAPARRKAGRTDAEAESI